MTSAESNAIITLQEVSKTYQLSRKNSVEAVKDVTLRIDLGDFLIITGRSGSGKTTLLNLISGMTRPTAGRVLLEGVEVWQLPDRQQSALRNQKLGFIFQFPSLIPALTTLENILLPTIMQAGHKSSQARSRALELLEQVGLSDKLDSYPRQLSAGQQQRVVIARSLINEPELILADEPTSNLDEQTEHEIMNLIQLFHQERNVTVLLVTHTAELEHYGNRAIRMAGGRTI